MLDKIAMEIRDDYIEHFRAFVTLLQDKGKRGAAEVKFSLSDDSPLFGRIYCSDYVENDDGHLTVHWAGAGQETRIRRVYATNRRCVGRSTKHVLG